MGTLLLSAVTARLRPQVPTDGPGQHSTKAADLMRQGRLEEAVALLQEELRTSPDNVEALVGLGTALSLVPRRNQAVEVFLRAIELQPDEVSVLASAGAAFARLGERDAALQVFRRAVALDPVRGDVHLNIALILASKEEFDTAEEHISSALRLPGEPRQKARLHFLRGRLRGEQGRPELAAEDLQRSVDLDPSAGEAVLALGVVRKRLLQENEALDLFRRAVELRPADPMAHYQLALELLRRGEARAASGHLLRAHELSPEDQSVVYNLTRALHVAGRRAESIKYRQLLARMIESGDVARENELETARLHGEAVRLEGEGRYGEALDRYRNVLRIAPLNVVARRNLALVLCRLDRWYEGIDELEAILRDNPDDAETARTLAIVLDQAPPAE